MKQSPWKIPLTLALICAVAGGLVAGIYSLTAARIEQNAQDALIRVVETYLPEATEGKILRQKPLSKGVAEEILTVKKGDALLGYAVTVAPQGFGGEIRMTVVLSPHGEVLGTGILSATETPGLGDRALSEEYVGRFNGLTFEKWETDSPDGISGATISSQGVKEGIEEALRQFTLLKEAAK